MIDRRSAVVAVELAICQTQNSNFLNYRCLGLRWESAGKGVGYVGRGRHIHHCRGTVGVHGEYPDAIQGAARRNNSANAKKATCRFQSDEVVETGRDPAGARSIGSQRKANEPARYRHRRTGTRSTRDIGFVVWVLWNAVWRTCTGKAGRKLVEIGFAHENTAGIQKTLHDRGRSLRYIREIWAACRRRQTLNVYIVFDCERHTIERKLGRGRLSPTEVRRTPRHFLLGKTQDPHMIVTRSFDPSVHLFNHVQRRVTSSGIALLQPR